MFLPPVFGIAGIVLGAIATKRGEKLGPVGLGLSIAGLVIGMLIGFLMARAIYG